MARRRDLAEVLDTASALLAEEGLDGLTLRAIARRMDAHLNSVSFQVKTKGRLLELLSDRMLADVRLDGLPAAPRARASEIAARYRRVLLSRRDGARLMAGTSAIEQHTLAIGEALIGALLDGGADPVTATRTFWSMSYLILGAVQEEQGADASAGERLEAALAAGSFPVLTRVEGSLVDDSFDARFTFAMDALLDAAGLPVA
jgi:TetR/AcrR family tetracycline transcriptional repressor